MTFSAHLKICGCLIHSFKSPIVHLFCLAAAPTITAAITLDPRTWLCHIGNVHPLFLCHEAQDGKYCEARDKTGTAVEASQQQTVPMSHICHEEDLLMNTQGSRSPLQLNPSLKTEASPVAVVFVLVVAPQRRHGAQTDGIGEEDLCAGINPHLPRGVRKWGQKGWGLLMRGSTWDARRGIKSVGNTNMDVLRKSSRI